MANKHPGTCPHCRKIVSPRILGENFLRRDKCECTSCQGVVYACRTPGCGHYAKGSESYDAEFCPACANSLSETVASVAQSILATIAAGAAAKGARKFRPAEE